MIVLQANDISKSYGITPVLTNVTFHINKGDRAGIVGANGAGKSTLLNILTGELTHDSGSIAMPSDISVGYLRQSGNFDSENTVYDEMLGIFADVIKMEEELALFAEEIAAFEGDEEALQRKLHRYDEMQETFKEKNGYTYKSEIKGILNSMAFPQEYFDKPVSLLSGGEKTRLSLAALLLRKPDILLLDEPTNHLDIGTLKWLEQYLKSYAGTILLISHDRYFLDQTTNRILEVEHHQVTSYDGNYSTFVEKKRFREEELLRQYESQKREIDRQEEIIRRFKQHGTEKLAKRAQSREKKLDKVERLEKPQIKRGKMKISFREAFQSGNDVVQAQDLSLSFGTEEEKRVLFSGLELDIKRGERICLVGPNGIGKTSLLKIIMNQLSADSGIVRMGHNVAIGYYDQHQELLNDNETVVGELHSAYRLYNETELRSFLGRFLFKGEDVFKRVGDLSGGERARLSLLKLMMSGSNLLIMDEPTNHLDIASKEVFEEALLEYPGTLLLVSHDRYFLNRIPTAIYEMSGCGVQKYLGGYDYYMEKKESIASGKMYLDELQERQWSVAGREEAQQQALSEKEKRAEERKKAKGEEAQKRKREKQRKEAEDTISLLEEEISALEAELCKEEVYTDFTKSAELSQSLENKKAELEEVYGNWVLLSEE